MCRNKTGFLRQSPSHDDPMRRIEAPTGFAFDDGTQSRSEFGGWNHFESQSRVERHVERDIPERCQRSRLVAGLRRPLADVPHKLRPETATAMLRVHIEFLQMCGAWLDHLDMRKTHRGVVSQDDPEKAIALRLLQDIMARRFLLK